MQLCCDTDLLYVFIFFAGKALSNTEALTREGSERLLCAVASRAFALT
jgi:hypothetical protein